MAALPGGTSNKPVAAFLVVMLTTIAGVGLLSLAESQPSVTNQAMPERSGPISTWPASWTPNPCSAPEAGGNDTTQNLAIPLPPSWTPLNMSLDQLYANIANSESFKNTTSGLGWVTTLWFVVEGGFDGQNQEFVEAQFILLNGTRPDTAVSYDGVVTAVYNIDAGTVSIDPAIDAGCTLPPAPVGY